jgi:hypothetical protein
VPDPTLRPLLSRHYAALRRALIARHALRGAATVAGLVALALAVGMALPASPATAWARLVALAAGSLAALALVVARLRGSLPGFAAYLEDAEARFPEIRSWLRNALDLERRPAPDTSPALVGAVAAGAARRLESVPLATLRPRLEPRQPLLVLGAALVAVAALGVLAPERAARSWATLWSPATAAPPVRLVVEPGAARVTPGASLAVRARVWGTAERPRLVRDGEAAPVAIATGESAEGERSWRFDLTQLTRAQSYRVRVGRAESPLYRITLAGEPQAVSFEVEYQVPAYAGLPPQRGASTRGDLSALVGSRARVEALFDRDLDGVEATLPGRPPARWTAVTPRRWRGEVPIEREGEYALAARAAGGASEFRYRIHPVADAAPVLVVRVPQGDVDLPAGQQIPLEVLAQDDLGLGELRLQVRRDADAPWTTRPLARFPNAPREAAYAKPWDASALGLLPGQTASFRLELLDDNTVSGPGRALSPVFELRFPSLAELYEHVDQRQEGAQRSLEKLAEQAHELQKTLDKLDRELRPSPTQSQSFERSEELKSALQRQEQISRALDEAAHQVQESAAEANERQAFNQEVGRKLQEIADLVRQIQSQDFRDALQRMREALAKLDQRSLERELPQWRMQNQEMLKNLERTAALLRAIREEERLNALAQRAEEQKANQDQLNREHAARETRPDSAAARDAAKRQESAAEESQRLAKDVEQLAQETEDAADAPKLEDAAKEIEQQATPSQRQAAQSAPSDPSAAQRSGNDASQSLQRAAQGLRQSLADRQAGRDAEDLAALRRAAQDLNSLQREAQQNLASGEPPSDRADRQSDLAEGVARVSDSLQALSKRTPFLKPKLSESLGRAMSQLSNSAKMMDGGNRPGGESAGRSASQALNEAVAELRAAESSMCNKPGSGPGGKAPSNGNKLGDLGEQQGRLNERSRRLTQQMSEQIRLSTGDQEEMRRLAEEQRRIREQVEQVAQDEEARAKTLGRLDGAQREMKEVEEQLRSGAVDGDLEQKQQHILSRLLDAQRSLNRQDFDPQRESRPGEDVARRSPGELPADLMREGDRLRLDLMRAESDRYPAQYRAFVEAYLRSLNGSPR